MTLGTELTQSGAVKPSSLEQQKYESDLFADRITEIPSNMKARWAYDESNNCIYGGYAPKGLAEGTDGWLIQKFTWSGSNCTERNIAYGNWTNRASYTYD